MDQFEKFRGNDHEFEDFLPPEIRDFDLRNIAEEGLLATAPEKYRERLATELSETRTAMNLVLNALPQLTKNPEKFRTYRNSAVTPITGGFLYDWGRIRVCLHESQADTTGIPHQHHTGRGDETAAVAAVQIDVKERVMMDVSHRILAEHGGAYLFTVDSVWDARKKQTFERCASNMDSPFVRPHEGCIPVEEGDFFALGSESYHNVTRKGLIPNWLNPMAKRSLSVFTMLIHPDCARKTVGHDLEKKKRESLWKDLMHALRGRNLIHSEEQLQESTIPTQSSPAAYS